MRLVITLALVATPLAAQDLRIAELGPDVPTVLNHPHNWDESCTLGWVRLEMLEEPRHGTVSLGDGLYMMGDVGGGRVLDDAADTGCPPREVSGGQLIYDPDDGFRGADAFAYRMHFEHLRPLDVAYAVTVGD